MIEERRVGPHCIVREAEMADRPYFLMLDFTHVESLPAPARRAVGELGIKVNLRAIGMYGGSFHVRVVAKLINGAIALFRKNSLPQQFFDTREAALAWFDQLRKRDPAGGA